MPKRKKSKSFSSSKKAKTANVSVPINMFEMLPNEILRQICENMTYQQLTNFTKSFKRAFEVCGNIEFESKMKKILKEFNFVKLREYLLNNYTKEELIQKFQYFYPKWIREGKFKNEREIEKYLLTLTKWELITHLFETEMYKGIDETNEKFLKSI